MKKIASPHSILFFLFLSVLFNSNSQVKIPKRGFALDWIIPEIGSNPSVEIYDKIELGINVHDSIEKQIDNFFDNNKQENNKKLNPFNSDDIDIYAEFRQNKTDKVIKIHAFYFEDLLCKSNSENLSKGKSKTRFRIRLFPDLVANWNFKLIVKIKNQLIVTLGEYEFKCIDSKHTSKRKRNQTQFNSCFGNDFWLKDLWLSIFEANQEGNSTWLNFQDYKTLENFNAIKSYLEVYGFNLWNVITEKENKLSKNKYLELIALHHHESHQSTGIILNRTWNFYSEGKQVCSQEKIPKKRFRKFKEQKSGNRASQIQISGFKKDYNYTIEWFNPQTNTLLELNKIKSTKKGSIVLEYPTLSKNLPYVIYKLI